MQFLYLIDIKYEDCRDIAQLFVIAADWLN